MSDLSTQIRAYYEATTEPVGVDAVRNRDARFTVVTADQTVEPVGNSEFVPAPDAPARTRALLTVAAVAAGIAFMVGVLIVGARLDDNPGPVDEQRPTAVTTTLGGALLPEASVDLPLASRPVAVGRYSTSVLGVDVTFDVPRDMLVLTNRGGAVAVAQGLEGDVLDFPPSGEDWRPSNVVEVSFHRISGWSTRDESIDVSADAVSIDPNDIDGWVAANDVSIVSDREIEIDGRMARAIDVEVDPATSQRASSCPEWHQPCFYAFAVASAQDATRARTTWVSATTSKRFYLITIDGSEPLLIAVTAPLGSDRIDTVETEMIATLEIGPDAPPLGGG